MSRRAGSLGLLIALVAALVLVWSAPAWAEELHLSPAAGAAGSEITVTGTGFDAAEVQIRWGSRSGPVLGTAQGPDFTMTVEVPDSPPNSYPVVAVVTDGNTVATSDASFQVTPADEPAVREPGETATTTPPERVPGTNPPVVNRAPTNVDARGSGVTGGLDPSLPDTVDRVPDPGGTVSGSNPAADAARAAADALAAASAAAAGAGTRAPDGALTTTPLPAGGASTDGPSSTDPEGADAGVSAGRGQRAGRAAGPTPTSQSSGAVRSPTLLFAGLAMIMAGAAFLAFRNRHPPGGAPPPPRVDALSHDRSTVER